MNVCEKEKGLVSIIIPVYNVKNYIQACISSVIRQSYKNLEIILVDDRGEDDSIMLAETLLRATDLRWFVLEHDSRRGLSVARNDGVSISNGEYLFFLDSDDYISDTSIEHLVYSADTYQSDIVLGSIVYDKNGQILSSHWNYTEERTSDNPLNDHINQSAYVMACNKLIRRKFYLESGVKFINDIIHEDEPWSFSLMLRAKRISFIKEITYYYRKHGESITARIMDEFRLKCLFCNLHNCTKESYNYGIWENCDFKTWYARSIFSFCKKVLSSKIGNNQKCQLLDRVYHELRLPTKELNEIHMYSLVKLFSFLLPKYRWLKMLVALKNMQSFIMEKYTSMRKK